MASEQDLKEAQDALPVLADSMSLSEISAAKTRVLDLKKIDPNTVVSPIQPVVQTSVTGMTIEGQTTVSAPRSRRSRRMIRRR